MIRAYLPSLNRASQCEYLLRSAEKHAPGLFEFTVFYKATTQSYREGYEKLAEKYPKTSFVGESDFADDMIWHLEDSGNGLWAIFTDDTVFFRDLPEKAFVNIAVSMNNPSVFSFTLRLGKNVNIQNYQTNEHLKWPDDAKLFSWADIYKWNFKKQYCYNNVGYSFNCDGTIYWAQDILALAQNKTLFPNGYKNLRGLEGKISHADARDLIRGEYACCFPESVCTNISINEVTDDAVRAGLYFPMSIEEANQKFLDGYVLYYDIDPDKIRSCHKEVPWSFIKEGGRSEP